MTKLDWIAQVEHRANILIHLATSGEFVKSSQHLYREIGISRIKKGVDSLKKSIIEGSDE